MTPQAAHPGPPLVRTEAVGVWGQVGQSAGGGCGALVDLVQGLDGGDGSGALPCSHLGPCRLGLWLYFSRGWVGRWVGWFAFLLPTRFSLCPLPSSQPGPIH